MSDEENLQKELKDLRERKPKYPITTPHKLGIGLLCLIFAGSFTFVFIEERQRGIALLIAIPLAICLVYFFYLWLKDTETLKIYKLYRDDILSVMKKKNPKYELRREEAISELGAIKTMVGIIAIIVLIIKIAMQAEKVRLSSTFSILFAILLVAFVLIEDYEGKTIEKQIKEIENEIFIEIRNNIVEGGATGTY